MCWDFVFGPSFVTYLLSVLSSFISIFLFDTWDNMSGSVMYMFYDTLYVSGDQEKEKESVNIGRKKLSIYLLILSQSYMIII